MIFLFSQKLWVSVCAIYLLYSGFKARAGASQEIIVPSIFTSEYRGLIWFSFGISGNENLNSLGDIISDPLKHGQETNNVP